jgi:hypothetical protein
LKAERFEKIKSDLGKVIFANLKLLRLHKTYLDVGDLFAHTQLMELEILLHEEITFAVDDNSFMQHSSSQFKTLVEFAI